MNVRSLAAGVLGLLLPAIAAADGGSAVVVRVGSHDGYGRVAFALPPRTEYHLTQQDRHVVIQFGGELRVGPANAIPHNVVGITGGAGQATLELASGTTLHDWRYGDLLVIDVLDPATQTSAAPPQKAAAAQPGTAKPDPAARATASPDAAKPDPAKPPAAAPEAAKPDSVKPDTPGAPANAAQPAAAIAAPMDAAATKPEPPVAAPAIGSSNPAPLATASPAAPHDAAPGPSREASAAATDPRPETESDSRADGELDIPADPRLGLATFRVGSQALIVLDQPRIIDTAPLRDDTVFSLAAVQTLPTATVIRVPLDPGTALAASRNEHSWRIAAVAQSPTLRPIQAAVTDDRLLVQAAAPGAVVSVIDPGTGATLLVGTQRTPGQGVPARHRTSEFSLLSSWQGVAVEPHGDSVVLRPTAQGFSISGITALSPATETGDLLAHSSGLTRQFDFPSQPTEALLRRLQRQVQEAAAAPVLARGPHRVSLARSMIGLGLGLEADSVLRLAAADDPHVAADPEVQALLSIAALLANRPEEAGGIADPALPQADDIMFWRGVRSAELRPGSAEAAALFAATAPLVLAYPPTMRDRLLPLIAETLVTGGETGPAAALLAARPADATLDLARAMLTEAQGDNVTALAGYDGLAQSRDQSVHARAAVRAVELRLAGGAIDARQAAGQLERLLYAWRGDARERAVRERLAELEARSGDWRGALNLLRETEALFPDDKAEIHGELREMFAALLRGDAVGTLPPLDLVAMVEENADLLPTGPDGDALQGRLADRLLALDLPKRAGPVLEKLMRAAGSAPARAGFGARLAALRLGEDDPAGALAALDASAASDLASDLGRRRTLLAAEANARRGDTVRALAALGGLDDAAADEARATILERTNDWAGAQKALASYVARTLPPSGKLDEAQRRTLLRLATAASRAGDDAALADLRQREGPRMDSGPMADMFRLLTADQVRSAADLKRSGQEAALARGLPGQLKTLQPGAGLIP